MTHKAELTPENIKNPKLEGVFTMRLNGEYFMDNMSGRAEKLAFIAEHNPLLAAHIITHCLREQKEEQAQVIPHLKKMLKIPEFTQKQKDRAREYLIAFLPWFVPKNTTKPPLYPYNRANFTQIKAVLLIISAMICIAKGDFLYISNFQQNVKQNKNNLL